MDSCVVSRIEMKSKLKIDPCVVYMNGGIGIEILYDNI